MAKKNLSGVILIIFFCVPFSVPAQTDPNNWEKLNLSSTSIAGTKVYYENSFEPNLPFFENAYEQFLTEKNRIDSILTQKNQILADINDFLGIEDAADFIEYFDTNKYQDIKNEINLRYWMTANLCILSKELPNNNGKRFIDARYSYATFEIQRLIEKFGIECISKILDEITSKQSRTSNDLINAIKKVTNEDMNLRLAAYQSFGQKQEGIEKYAKIYFEAKSKNDLEQMAFSLLRAHELRSPSNIQLYIQDYILVSMYLFKMGYEKEADSTMAICMELCSNLRINNSRELALDTFIIYALGCNQPLKAVEEAEELLQLVPDNTNALAIQLFVCLENNQPDKAVEMAKKIIKLSKDTNSLGYTVASSILSYDPNQIK